MTNRNVKSVLAGLLLSALSLQMQACGGNKDPEIQTAIAAETQHNPDLAGVNATVDNGIVVLSGECRDKDSRKRAEKAIEKIDGIRNITNNIIVTPESEIVPDKDLKKSAEKIASKYKGVQTGVNEGIITLRGEVKAADLQPLMMDLNALHARRIDNQLAIK